MLENILRIIDSNKFAIRLNDINRNYSNLKQENHIRNAILELFNDEFSSSLYKAVAEHPREKSRRVDLSVVNKENNSKPYTIELKFQYTNDFQQFLKYEQLIDNDFERILYKEKCDTFILIISHWNKTDKQEYDEIWGIRPEHSLSRFLSLDENWKQNISDLLSNYKNVDLKEKSIVIKEPYETFYHFYIMSRNILFVNNTSIGL